jgi:hypothetical protein
VPPNVFAFAQDLTALKLNVRKVPQVMRGFANSIPNILPVVRLALRI